DMTAAGLGHEAHSGGGNPVDGAFHVRILCVPHERGAGVSIRDGLCNASRQIRGRDLGKRAIWILRRSKSATTLFRIGTASESQAIRGSSRLSPPPPPLVDSAQGSNALGLFLGTTAPRGMRQGLTYDPAPLKS